MHTSVYDKQLSHKTGKLPTHMHIAHAHKLQRKIFLPQSSCFVSSLYTTHKRSVNWFEGNQENIKFL